MEEIAYAMIFGYSRMDVICNGVPRKETIRAIGDGLVEALNRPGNGTIPLQKHSLSVHASHEMSLYCKGEPVLSILQVGDRVKLDGGSSANNRIRDAYKLTCQSLGIKVPEQIIVTRDDEVSTIPVHIRRSEDEW